jgi:hypothetical protein
MALDAATIANAAAYYAGQNARISALIRNAPANVAAVQAGGRVSAKGTPIAPAVAAPKAAKKTPQMDNVQRTVLGLTGGGKGGYLDPGDTSPTASLQRWLNTNANPVYGFANALLQKQSNDLAPKNAAQWVMNLLSSGVYVAAHDIRNVQDAGKSLGTDIGTGIAKGSPDFGKILGDLGPVAAAAPLGLAQGVAEGVGARFNGQRPLPIGQDLEHLGVTKAVESLAAGAGATPTGAHFIDNTGTIGGLLGFAGDVALDPTTYIGGLGLLKGIGSGARALADTARAGEGVASALKAGAKGVGEGVASAAADRAAAAAGKAQRNALLKGDLSKFVKAGGHPSDFVVTQQIARDSAADLAGVPKDAELPIPRKVADTPQIPHADLKAAIDELVPKLTGTATRDVPAEAILKTAARPGERAIAPELADNIRAAADTPAKVNEIRPAIATIATTKEGRAALAAPITVAGKTMKVSDAVEAVATRRLTGGDAASVRQALEQHLGRQTARQAVWAAPDLRDAVTKLLPPFDNAPIPAGGPGATFAGLARSMRTARSMTERKNILSAALGTQQTRYQTFDQAMLAATNNQVEVNQMREMLKALGIDSTMTDPAAVQKTLTGLGAARWSDIQAAVRNPAEVLSDHGVSIDEGEAARLADDIAEARQAHGAYQQVVDALGYDPAAVKPPRYNPDTTPAGGASIGQAIHQGVAKLGELFHGKQLSGVYGRQAMQVAHRAIISTLKLRGAGVIGRARGDNLLDDYLGSTTAIENYYRSLGQIPYLPNEAGRTPFYVSLGQVLSTLPRDTVKDALFPLRYDLGDRVGDEAFRKGLSIYPTTIAAGARASMQAAAAERGGEDTLAAVLEAMAKDGAKNQFQQSERGVTAIAQLARDMAEPAFQSAMKSLHDQQLLVATRIAQKTAEGVVLPTGARIAAALSADAERGAITKAIRDGYADIHAATSDLDGAPTLAHDLATQRLDNALVNGVLGEWGHAVARLDGRAATAARTAAKDGATAGREASTGRLTGLLDDSDELTADAIGQRIDTGDLEDVGMEPVRALAEFQHELGQQGIFGKLLAAGGALGRGVEGEYGKGALFPLMQEAERGAKSDASQFHRTLVKWRDSRGGARDRLGDALQLGRRASLPEMDAATRTWWSALSQTLRRYPGLADGSLHDALLRGAEVDARAGIAAPIPALDAAQADMAMEMLGHIRQIFQTEAGPLHRLGVRGADLNSFLLRFGHGDSLADDAATPLELADHWMNLEPEHPLDTLQGWRSAADAAAQRPILAAGVTHQFGNPADWGLTREEAIAQGWRTIDNSSGSLGRWFQKGTLLPPEIRRNLIYVQHAMDELDRSLPKFWSMLFAPTDMVTAMLKPSMTIWRLGHHVTNILGNNLFMLMHGFSPLYNARVLGTLRLLPGTPALDDAALSHFDAMWRQNVADRVPGFTAPLKTNMLTQNARVALKNGQVLDIPPEQLAELAMRDGIVMTAHQAKDLAPEQEISSLSGAWNRFTSSRLNVIARANRGIANGTSLYENITRLSVMIQQLERGTYRSIDEAMSKAFEAVQATHPTRESLSVADRKYTTRIVLFHNWVRGAIGAVARTALERPKLVTIPSDFQYNLAEAQGLQPESIGKPLPSDPRIASYYENGLLGPTWIGGLSPFGGIGDLDNGEPPHEWGASLSAPQIDALTNYFGGVNFGDDPLTNARVLAGGVNPVFSAPFEAISNSQWGSETGQQIYNPQKGDWAPQYASWLWNQTGFPASVTSAFGLSGTHATWTAAENQGDQSRKLFNFLTGLKVVDYTNPTSAKIGESETGQRLMQELRNMGYSDAAIKALKSYWSK